METLIESINHFTPTFLLVGGSIGAVVFLIYQVRYRSNRISNETIETYEKRVKQLEDEARRDKASWEAQAKEMTRKIDSLTTEVAKLTGIINEKNDRIKTLEDFVHNSNPAMADFIAIGTKAAIASELFMKDMRQSNKEIHDGVVEIKGILTPGPKTQ